MGDPPSSAGACQPTSTEDVFPTVVTSVGGPGTVRGVAVSTATAPAPIAFIPRTRTSTGVPFVRPVSSRGPERLPFSSQVSPPSSEYSIPVSGAPPSEGKEIATATVVLPGVSSSTGCGGTPAGLALSGFEAPLTPTALRARSCTVTLSPLFRPVIVTGPSVRPAECQVTPASRVYSRSVTGDPPLPPIVASTVSCPSPRCSAVSVGASGAEAGVPEIGAELAPSPTLVTARTSTG
jgi:hypothetical protein